MTAARESMPQDHVAVLQYGPVCGEYLAGGFQTVATTFPPELQDLAAQGALVVIGHPVVGLEHLVNEVRSKLPPGHLLIALPPCHSTEWFWETYSSVPIDEVADPDQIVDGCPNDEEDLLRRLLEEGTANREHSSGVGVVGGRRRA